jgi:RhoGAP domain
MFVLERSNCCCVGLFHSRSNSLVLSIPPCVCVSVWFPISTSRNLSNVLDYLMLFLIRLCNYSHINKMTPSNVAIVFGPTLLRPRQGMCTCLCFVCLCVYVCVCVLLSPLTLVWLLLLRFPCTHCVWVWYSVPLLARSLRRHGGNLAVNPEDQPLSRRYSALLQSTL